MAMTLIQLAGIEKEDFSLLVGKAVLLKFTEQPSPLDRSGSLRRLLSSRDLLLDEEKLGALSSLLEANAELQAALTASIRRRSLIQSTEGIEPKLLDLYKRRLTGYKELVKISSDTIRKIQNELKLYLAQPQDLYFCKKCDAYLGPIDETLPNKCQACQEPATGKANSTTSFRLIDDGMHNYLQGSWVQDYVARLLRKAGWKIWTECLVMGASGVSHQIDLLAVHEATGRVMIAECKTQAVSDHAFQLITQFADIQPGFALLISRNPMNECDGKSLIQKKPGLKLIELAGKSDAEISSILTGYLDADH